MPIDVQALDRAVDDFINIVSGDATWTSVLDRFDSSVGAAGTVLFRVFQPTSTQTREAGPPRGAFPRSTGVEGLVDAYLKEGWISYDTRYNGVTKLLHKGVITDDDVSTTNERRRSPFYQDFIAYNGFSEFAGLRLDINEEICCASIQRGRDFEPFTPEELALLVQYAPRISMAASMVFQLENMHIAGAADALEAMSMPAFILERNGRVAAMNSMAPRLFGRGLDVLGGKLIARGSENAKLQRYLVEVIDSSELSSPISGRPLTLRRRVGRPLIARAQRLRPHHLLAYLSKGHCILTISDPDDRPSPSAEVLQAAFDLTTKETAVLLAFHQCSGDWHKVCGQTLISYETFRSHMKNIHRKTSTRTQGELMALTARLGASGGS
jgi:hypothetical protein